MAKEIWCDVNGYDGLYQASNFGRVLSLNREVRQGKYGKTRTIRERVMKPTDNGNGYLIVSLRSNNHRKNFYVHRLVAEHFVPNCSGGEYVNHKDYDTRNNRADNLEWCTQKQNIRYSSPRMKKQHKSWRESSTKEKHIYLKNRRFRVWIPNKIDRTFRTLDEAIHAREVVLNGKEYLARR